MGTIWTPSGERPVKRDPPAPDPGGERRRPADTATDTATATADPATATTAGAPAAEDPEAQLAELTRRLLSTPAATVVANHAFGLFELGALHLAQQPPNLTEAALAIDAMGALVEGIPGRLGEHEASLREGLAQIRLAFVQLRAATEPGGDGGPDPAGG